MPGVREMDTFCVLRTDQRWYTQNHVPTHQFYNQLAQLHEENVRAVQQGESRSLLRDLKKCGLVIQRSPTWSERSIKFFVATRLDEGAGNASVEDAVVSIFQSQCQKLKIRYPSIYRGYGFCSILFKGQLPCSDYFRIADLINALSDQAAYTRTQTYLAHGPDHVIGDEVIGARTFASLRGVDLFAQSMVPMLYQDLSVDRAPIERFINDSVRTRPNLTQSDVILVGEYLDAYVKKDALKMASVLKAFFGNTERYLRDNHQLFFNRLNHEPKAVYQQCKITKRPQDLTLSELLTLYSSVVKDADLTLFSGWPEMADLRNDVVHEKLELTEQWDIVLERLLRRLPQMREILSLVGRVTGQEYRGK